MEKIVKSIEYDYYSRNKIIDTLCDKYKIIKKSVIGKSCSGKEIKALKVGDAPAYCLIAAAFHGSERITSNIALMFLENLCEALLTDGYIAGLKARKALVGRGVIIVPCVNPDGCDISLLGEKACLNSPINIPKISKKDYIHWNSNLRGVDINHNFDADWNKVKKAEMDMGIYGPSPTRFGGFSPESEPETIALTKLCRKTKIRHVLALHTQGEVIYWDFGGKNIPRSRKMAEIMATSSGYALDVPTGIAVGGGFKDWFITEFSRPGFTAEMGKGKNPLSITQTEEIYRKTEEMLMLCSIM